MNKEQLIIKSKEMDIVKEFEGQGIEIILDENEEPLFELYSTGMALGYVKRNSTGKEYPQKDRIDKVMKNGSITGCVQGVHTYLNEDMLYDFMLEAHTNKCKSFRKWVTSEVLPSIRKHGAYISNNEEIVDQGYIKYTYGQLKNTFTNCPIESLVETYDECMEWNKQNKIRIPYANNSKRRKDATHTISDSKIMTMQKIISVLEDRNLLLCENSKFGLVSEVDSTIKQIKDYIKKQHNISNRGKLAGATKKINKLQDEVNYHNPNLDEFLEIPTHGYSTNYLFESYIYNGKLNMRKTDGYKKWINGFPNDLIVDAFSNVDLNKPTKLWLKFDCKEGIDSDNLIKSIQDQTVRALNAQDDNNIQLGSVEVNKRVKKYSEGKIYMLLKNIE